MILKHVGTKRDNRDHSIFRRRMVWV